jgi:hypothetical protein
MPKRYADAETRMVKAIADMKISQLEPDALIGCATRVLLDEGSPVTRETLLGEMDALERQADKADRAAIARARAALGPGRAEG